MRIKSIKTTLDNTYFSLYNLSLGVSFDFHWLNINYKKENFIEHIIPISFLFWKYILIVKIYYK